MRKDISVSDILELFSLPSGSSDAVIALLKAREFIRQHKKSSYSVKDPKGIEELKSVKIGSVDQWIHIRGRDRSNPVLLLLHGGPGFGYIGYFDTIQRPWEDYFTVVQWDQRQTGKSYYSADDENSPLTVQQFVQDTREILQYLRAYLGQDKLFLLGHSWGSVLGMHMVRHCPNWLHAYIGVGQVVSGMDNERILYDRLLMHAKREEEVSLVEKLREMYPYPNPEHPEKSFVENSQFLRRELSRISGESLMHHMFFNDTIEMINFDKLISPHLSLEDHKNNLIGDEIALFRPPYSFTKEFMRNNLPKEIGSSFDVPIFFFTGKHDWQTPVLLSDRWFSEITAPFKELVHFENSSHVVFNEEPGRFLVALVNKVLPFAKK